MRKDLEPQKIGGCGDDCAAKEEKEEDQKEKEKEEEQEEEEAEYSCSQSPSTSLAGDIDSDITERCGKRGCSPQASS